MDIKLLIMYFFIGGTTVTAITYLGSQGKSMIAAMLALLPTITLITISSIYATKGAEATVSYAKGMLILLPAWILYVVCVIFVLPRFGLVGALIAGIAVYLIIALLILRFTQ